jgi:PEP-CTERM motif
MIPSVQYDTFALADYGNPTGTGFVGSVTYARAAAVPEPVTLALFGTGIAGALAMRRRKAKKVRLQKH